ncbi:MAG: hypothetical protein K2Z81_24035, partial [Cyanobacteria bacterium]|nr:hypothetical protein [Cyanobacteriota bacterium]
SGIGKGNSLNNPQIFSEERKTMLPGDERARRAGAALMEISQSNPDAVSKILSDGLLRIIPDAGVRLETLGKVMSDAGKATESGKEALFHGLSSPERKTRDSAARGVVEI